MRLTYVVTVLAFVASSAYADPKKKGTFDDVVDDAPQAKKKDKKKAPKAEKSAKKPTKKDKKKKEPEPEIELDPVVVSKPAPAAPATSPSPAPTAAVKDSEPSPIEAKAAPKEEPASAPAESAGVEASVTVAPKHSTRKFKIRAGVALVKPLAQSRELELADIDGAASLAVQNGPIAGSGASVSSATIPAIIVGYQLPWLDGHLSLETVLGVPFTVKFQATGTLADKSIAPTALGIPTGVPPLGPELGEAKAAPPLVTAVYNVDPNATIQPFFGAGVAVLYAYDAHVTNPMLTAVAEPDFSISPAPGLVLQGGLEARITDRIFARLDVKFIALMMARGEVKHIQVQTPEIPLFDTVEVGTAKMNVWVNPLIVQLGVGTDF